MTDIYVFKIQVGAMDVKDVLRKGLQSTPKYLPVWYRYDKEGSIYNDKCLEEGSYYLYPAELSVLKAEVEVRLLCKNDT